MFSARAKHREICQVQFNPAVDARGNPERVLKMGLSPALKRKGKSIGSSSGVSVALKPCEPKSRDGRVFPWKKN
jgi:hypothetical protein